MNNKGADQTARMRRLICAFVVHIWHKTHFLMAQLISSLCDDVLRPLLTAMEGVSIWSFYWASHLISSQSINLGGRLGTKDGLLWLSYNNRALPTRGSLWWPCKWYLGRQINLLFIQSQYEWDQYRNQVPPCKRVGAGKHNMQCQIFFPLFIEFYITGIDFFTFFCKRIHYVTLNNSWYIITNT